jgi:drug/metabolite transporter (DMT)-like permease
MKTKDWLNFWFLGLVWGTSFLWIKIAVADVSPAVLVSFRAFFGATSLAIAILAAKKAGGFWQTLREHWFDFTFMGFFNIAVPWILISWAEQSIDSGLAAVLNSTMPLFTIMIAPLFIPDDRITLPKVVGMVIGFLGVVVLLSPDLKSDSGSNLLGQVGMMLAALSYSVSSIYARKKGARINPEMMSMMQFVTGTVFATIFSLVAGGSFVFPKQPMTWVALLWLGLLGSALAYMIYFSMLKRIGPTRMSTVTYIPPMIGMMLGALFLGEQITRISLLGAVLILSGILIVNIQRKPAPIPVSR